MRPLPSGTFASGTVVQLAALDSQIWKDLATVQIAPTTALGSLIGIVSEDDAGPTYGGFDGKGGVVAPAVGARGSGSTIGITTGGFHTAALIDNSGGSTIALVDKASLVVSSVTAGRMQAVTTAAVSALIARAILPAAGPFSSLGSSTLAAATQTVTLAGTPAAGTIITIPVQIPFSDASFGTALYRTVVVPALTTAQATSVTTAAAAVIAFFNLDPIASLYYLATASAGVITLTVVSQKFRVTIAGYDANHGADFYVTSAGAAGNYLSLATVAISGGGTIAAGGSNSGYAGYPTTSPLFSGGTGYLGQIPVLVYGEQML